MSQNVELVGDVAASASAPRRLCLNMIVKNEVRILERCLVAVADHIACWVICDTGSTDGTQDLIRSFFAARGLPGELHTIPFINFGQARNEALRLARAAALEYDYILLCDADMELKVEDSAFRVGLKAQGYGVEQRGGRERYWNCRLVRRDSGALYKGVTHEFIGTDGDSERLHSVWFDDHANGANRPEKIERDTRLLEEDLERDPENPRTFFYLGQTHKLAGRFEDAARCYRRRVKLGGWQEEVWYAEWQEAVCRLKLGDEVGFERGCLAAYDRRPHRAEPLFSLAHFHREAGRHAVAMLYAEAGMAIPWPEKDVLFIDSFVYRFGLIEEYCLAAAHAPAGPRRDRARRLCDQLAFGRDVPSRARGLARRGIRGFARPAKDMLPGLHDVEIARPGDSGARAQGAALVECGGVLHLLQTLAPGRPGPRALLPQLVTSRLDADGKAEAPTPIAIPADFPTVTEDGRWDITGLSLFAWGDAPWCVASRRDGNGAWDGAVIARIDEAAGRLADWKMLPRDMLPKLPSSDWQPFITPGLPGFLAFIDPTVGVNLSQRPPAWQTAPGCAADHLHPASGLLPFDGGWITLLREAAPAGEAGGPLLRLGWLARDLQLQRLSAPFRFCPQHPSGATLGLARRPGEERLLVSFTTNSGRTRLATLAPKAIAGALRPVADFLLPALRPTASAAARE